MKKTLLVTSALVAAGLFSGEAFAQAKPMALTLGGYYFTSLNIVSQDSQAALGAASSGGGFQTTDHTVTDSGEIWFSGSLPLDNGITVGFRAELELMTHQDQIDEAWIDFRGSFGRLMIGQNDPVGREIGRGAPSATRATADAWGINENGLQTAPPVRAGTPFANFAGSAGDRQANAAAGGAAGNNRGVVGGLFSTIGGLNQGDGEEIYYSTPVFSGFQGHFSWKPRTAEYGFEQTTQNINNATNTYADLLSFGLVYDGKITDDVSLRVMGTWENGDPMSTFTFAGTAFNLDGRQNGYTGHAIVSFANIDLGGSFRYISFDVKDRAGGVALAANDRDNYKLLNWDLGIAYTFNPFKVGLTYFNGRDETAADATTGGDIRRTAWMVSGSYQLGPGVFVDAGVMKEALEGRSGVAGRANQTLDSVGFFLSTGVSF